MKRIVRLTESDLARIVKRVIQEQEETPKRLRGNYRIRSWTPDAWYDEDDRAVNPDDIEDYEEEVEFGPDEYDRYMEYTKDTPNKWNFQLDKHYYDRHYRPNNYIPIKIRKLRMK